MPRYKKPARQRGMKIPKGKRKPPRSGKPAPKYRRTWDTKGRWESDDLGSEYQ